MDIQYLKENNLLEAHKQFTRLAEAYYTHLPEEALEEAEDDQQQDPNAMPPQDPNAMGGGDPNAMPPADPNAMGGADPNAAPPADPNAMGGDGGMGGDPNAMPPADPNAMGGGDPNAMPPGPDPSMADGPLPEDQAQEDDGNTIDIDDLTKSAQKTYVKQNHLGLDLGKVDNKINNLVGTVDKLMSMIDSQNQEIESFKSEFIKRNPSDIEKLNLRSQDSAPFNISPESFWKNKAKDGNYDVYADNDIPTAKEWKLTDDDVNDYDDNDIANSFYKPSDDDIQTLDKIFKL